MLIVHCVLKREFFCCCCFYLFGCYDRTLTYLCYQFLLGFVAVHTIQLLLLVGESDHAHCGLRWAAVLPGVGDRVAYTTVSQPTSVAAVISLQLPSRVNVAHFGNLGTVVPAGLHSFIERELVGLDQPVETSW